MGKGSNAGFLRIHWPMRRARRRVLPPEFGPVTSITARYPQGLPPLDKRGDSKAMTGFLDHMVHPWSLLRGAGYVLLTYEILSLALQVFSGRRLAVWRVRGSRLAAGVGFLLADGLVKYFFLETVRQQLFANLN